MSLKQSKDYQNYEATKAEKVKEKADGFNMADSRWRSKREEELHREIETVSSEKAKGLFGDERERRAWLVAVKKSVEQSIQSQVRAALGTPPGEKRKKLHEKRLAEERQRRQLEINIDDRQRTVERRVYGYPCLRDDDGLLFQKREQYLQKYATRRSMRFGDGNSVTPSRLAVDSDLYLDPLSSEFNKKFSIYTRAALENADRDRAHRSTSYKANVYKRSPGCVWLDNNGERHEIVGPFWPKDHLPRYSCQKHIHFIPNFVERLNTEGDNSNTGTMLLGNEHVLYPQVWRGNLTVYERQNKGEANHSLVVPAGCAPCLAFESRFECGNLKQAKRIGSFEYDLVLSSDLYTNRHMQWYYFRVQNMVPGVTYKFNIINLLKNDSLYNYGMKPLLYSEHEAKVRGLGWKRAGSSISYYKTSLYKNLLLNREIVYHTLTFHMEFPHEGDTCYLAHCYPYSYTDLELYLRTLMDNRKTAQYVQREVLCKTIAGNNCYALTITSSQVPESEKLGVVISARVHPGETNASWMMKGMLDFLTSGHHIAEKLRRKFVFKLVPMLNPDGVIVGNYRTNLAARDLNRTYKDPKKESFPTVWHMKNMLEAFKKDHQVIIYCDLHGHSRKPNVFMYGCTADPKMASMSDFLEERLFPWMMSQKAPDKFSFSGCKFRVRKCKESTARVVMWRQMGIANSFTMEATFCGANFGDMEKGRHFHVGDFEEMGRHFCEVLLEYSEAKTGNRSEMTQAFVELACKMTRDILRQTLGNYHLKNLSDNESAFATRDEKSEEREGHRSDAPSEKNQEVSNRSGDSGIKAFSSSGGKSVNFMDVRVEGALKKEDVEVELSVKSVHADSFNGCLKILESLNLVDCFDESDSSDSDSDGDDTDNNEDDLDPSGNPSERKRKKKKKKKKKPKHWWDTLSKPTGPFETSQSITTNEDSSSKQKRVKTSFGKFVNPYTNRSNGGIPIFSQERIQERAKKKEEQLCDGSQEAERKDFMVKYDDAEAPGSAPFFAVIDDTEMNFVTAQRRVAYYMLADKTHPSYGNATAYIRDKAPLPTPGHGVDMESYKFDYQTRDGFGFTIRIPGRKVKTTRGVDALERAKKQPLQSFEEARGRPRKSQVTPVYAFDLTDERVAFPDRGHFYGNDFEEDLDFMPRTGLSKPRHFRRAKTSSFDIDDLEKRRDFVRTRSEHGINIKVNKEVTSQTASRRPRDERPMYEPSAPIPSYSHISSSRTIYKQR